ncbi:hypothetical protein [Tolypothrix sp. VBCCA 56010]|uniref:hypothetical protein n=1 Tax=Tolypothrix sp. VBCCA 56010 TaxID=3137731 RepID=UPI003D7CEB69
MKHKVLTNWFFAILIGYRVPMTQSFASLFNRNCIAVKFCRSTQRRAIAPNKMNLGIH